MKGTARFVSIVGLFIIGLSLAACLNAQGTGDQPVVRTDDDKVRPPVSKADIEIVRRARQILDSPAKWNRADNRICPKKAQKFSLYCALEKATDEVGGNFQHRGAAMQEARFVIEELAPKKEYEHRLMGYNNDPTTTFADIQKVFTRLEEHIAKRLADQRANGVGRAGRRAEERPQFQRAPGHYAEAHLPLDRTLSHARSQATLARDRRSANHPCFTE